MTSMLKQRLIGAAVLIALGVIFIPMLLTGDGEFLSEDMESNVPPKPMYELEVPKVIPLDKRSMQSSDPVVEPAAQVDKNEVNKNQENKTASAEPQSAAGEEPVAAEPVVAAKESATPAESNIEKPTVAEKTAPPAPAMETPSADKSAQAPAKAPEKTPATETVKKPVVSGWAVQLGSFSVQKNALKLRDSLRKKGYASFVEDSTKNGKTSYRVRVGPELTRELADELKKKLKAETKIDGFVVTFPAK